MKGSAQDRAHTCSVCVSGMVILTFSFCGVGTRCTVEESCQPKLWCQGSAWRFRQAATKIWINAWTQTVPFLCQTEGAGVTGEKTRGLTWVLCRIPPFLVHQDGPQLLPHPSPLLKVPQFGGQMMWSPYPRTTLGSFQNCAVYSCVCVCVCVCAHAQLLSHVQLFATPWTVDHQVPLSKEFSRQEYWSRLVFLTPRDLLNPGQNCISCNGRQILYHCATWDSHLQTWPRNPWNIAGLNWGEQKV